VKIELNKPALLPLIVIAVAMFASCDNLLLKPPAPAAAGSGETGAVHITLSDGRPADTQAAASLAAPRTLYPDTSAQWYRLAVSTENAALTVPPAMDLLPGQTEAALTLPVGTWTFAVTGFIGEDAIVAGEKTVTLTNVPQAVTIAVTRPLSGQGTLHYQVNWPQDAAVTEATLTLTRLDGTGDPETKTWAPGDDSFEDDLEVESGFYFLTVSAVGGDRNQTVTRAETVHIYSTLITDAVYEFTKGDFISVILGGTAQITLADNINGQDKVYITAYADAEQQNRVGSGLLNLANGQWTMTINSYYGSPTIYFRAEVKEGDDIIFYQDAGNIPTPQDDKTDINLGSLDLSATTVVRPAGGAVILIGSAAELAAINGDLTDPAKNYGKNAYILTNDIDLSDWGQWTPIGDHRDVGYSFVESVPFQGYFYGNGHTISGLRLSPPSEGHYASGLFGLTIDALIRDLAVENDPGAGELVINRSYAHAIPLGLVVGYARNTGLINLTVTINNLHIKFAQYGGYIGGAVGYAAAGTRIKNVFVSGNNESPLLLGSIISTEVLAGGITGLNSDSEITDSGSSLVTIYNDRNSSLNLGGLTGTNQGVIKQSFAAGTLTSHEGPLGGIAGGNQGTIDRCYSAVNIHSSGSDMGDYSIIRAGGIAGESTSSGSIINSYASGAVMVSVEPAIGISRTIAAGGITGHGGTISRSYAAGKITNHVGSGGSATTTSRVGGITTNINSAIMVSQSAALNPLVSNSGSSEVSVVNRIIGPTGGTYQLTGNIAFGGMTVNGLGLIDAETDPAADINGLGKTAAQLKQRATYEIDLGWDFDTIWEMGPAEYPYPVLKWQNGTIQIPEGFTSIQDQSVLARPAENNYRVKDGQGGSSDNLANPGESIYLDIPVKNVGGIAATGLQAAISTDSSYITIDKNTATLGDLDAGYYKILTGAQALSTSSLTYFSNQDNAFRLTIAADCPDGSSIPLTVTFTDSSNRQWAFPISLYITPNIPSTPVNVGVTAVYERQVVLGWVETTESIIGYNVYRASSPGGNYPLIDTVPSASYIDRDVEPSATYYYKVAALKQVGGVDYESPLSPALPVTTNDSNLIIAGSSITVKPSVTADDLFLSLAAYYEQVKYKGQGSSADHPLAVTLNIDDVSQLANGGDALGVLCNTLPDGLFVSYDLSNNTISEISDTASAIASARTNSSNITSIVLPDMLIEIGSNAFKKFSNLVSVNIPEGVTVIDSGVFDGCSELTSVVIPGGVTTIGSSAFYGCSGLTSVLIPEGVTTIGSYAFDRCSGLTNIDIPEGVTTIGEYAFNRCSGLTSIVIPEGVTTISYGAFYGCSGLTSVVIPEGVTSIGTYAFLGCSGLTSIDIPDSVTTIWSNVFAFSNQLTSVTFMGTTPPSFQVDAFWECDNLAAIYVPSGTVGAYRTAIGLGSSVSINSFYAVYDSDSLDAALIGIKENADLDSAIMVTGDFSTGPKTITDVAFNHKNIIIRSDHIIHTISLSGEGSEGSLFTVGSSGTPYLSVILQDINCNGYINNVAPLIRIDGGEFIINAGGTIANNRNKNKYINDGDTCGGGVYVNGGRLEMNGGSINDNIVENSTAANAPYGGGVYINSGRFDMNGGSVNGNTAASSARGSSSVSSSAYGGGIYVGGGIFSFMGGSISGNTASAVSVSTLTNYSSSSPTYANSYGGGVCVAGNGIFEMSGGIINGNTASSSTEYTVPSESFAKVYGGGVYISRGGSFTKEPKGGTTTSGFIGGINESGSDAMGNLFRNILSTSSNNSVSSTWAGDAIFYDYSDQVKKSSNVTIGENTSLSSAGSDGWAD
jgi:hypothetical protein